MQPAITLNSIVITGSLITAFFTVTFTFNGQEFASREFSYQFDANGNIPNSLADLQTKLPGIIAADLATVQKHALAVNPGVSAAVLQANQTPVIGVQPAPVVGAL